MGKYLTLRDQLVTVIQSVQIGGLAAFAEVSKEPKDQFTGTPAATIVPAEVLADIETNRSNLRSYGFNVMLHYPLNEGDSWLTAIDTLLELVDLCLDALDASDDLSREAHILEAAPLDWDIVKTGDNLQLLATIHTVAKVSITR